MKLSLVNGETIVVDPEDRNRCSDDCPHMQEQEYRAGDPMDRDKVVWKCGLTEELFPWDRDTRKFREIRNSLCLKLDPEPHAISKAMREKAESSYRNNPYPLDPDYTLEGVSSYGLNNFQARFGTSED